MGGPLAPLLLDDVEDPAGLVAALRGWSQRHGHFAAAAADAGVAIRGWTWDDMADAIVRLAGNP
jgi:hypothetical protein